MRPDIARVRLSVAKMGAALSAISIADTGGRAAIVAIHSGGF